MKRAIYRRHGQPSEVIELVTEPDLQPGPQEVCVRNQVMTINPADLLAIEGRYGKEPVSLPATPGNGAFGVVEAVGKDVKHLAIGDTVLPVGGGLWADLVVVHERMAPKAPDGVDPEQAAMMRANPGTAYLMLSQLADLAPGDWVVQNAANSNVGRMVVRFARDMGLHTVNIVRRADVSEMLLDDGADAVIVQDDESDLSKAILDTAEAPPRLALDAVGGDATAALAGAVGDGATVAVYGLLSGTDSRIGARDLVFRGVNVRGFWLADWYAKAGREQIRELHNYLAEKLAEGMIHTEVEERYPLSRVKEAVAHAARDGRSGKIVLVGDQDA